MTLTLRFVVLLAVLAIGCNSAETDAETDTEADAGDRVRTDAGTDAGADTGTATKTDAAEPACEEGEIDYYCDGSYDICEGGKWVAKFARRGLPLRSGANPLPRSGVSFGGCVFLDGGGGDTDAGL